MAIIFPIYFTYSINTGTYTHAYFDDFCVFFQLEQLFNPKSSP